MEIKLKVGEITTKKELDIEVREYVNSIPQIEEIKSIQDRTKVYERVTAARRFVKRVGEERLKVTRVIDAEKKKYTELEKRILEPLAKVLEKAEKSINDYDNWQLEVEQTRQKNAQKAFESVNFPKGEVSRLDTTYLPLPAPSDGIPTSEIKGLNISISYEIEDFAKIPEKYFMIDQEKVLADLKQGIKIEGIRKVEKAKTRFS